MICFWQVASFPLYAVDWSVHAPQQFMLGGMTRALHLFDTRTLGDKSKTSQVPHTYSI